MTKPVRNNFKGLVLNKSKGFTLIELLIVIAVIGILATAVLSAINPVEQIRKARDSRRKSNAAELLNAMERYFTSYEIWPSGIDITATSAPGTQVTTLAGMSNEIKPEFGTRITSTAANYLYAYSTNNEEFAHICYEIESFEQKTKYTGTSVPSGGKTYTCLPE